MKRKKWVALALQCIALYGIGAEIDHAIVGIYAVHMKTKEVLIEENSQVSMIPASCMKVVTTGAALHLLGPDFRFMTSVEYDGECHNGIIFGNIYIKGGGDPCLGSERIAGSLSWKEQIDAWADSICSAGIKQIEGTVIGDASLWEKALAVPSWNWEDLGNYYGAGACALTFHENYYFLHLCPGQIEGDKVTVLGVKPPLDDLILHSELVTGPIGSGDEACIYGTEFSSHQWVRGTVPAAIKEFSIKGMIPDPARYCAELLYKRLQEKGVLIQKKKYDSLSKRHVLSTTQSPIIKDIVYHTNQTSINLYAEHLLKKMGEVVLQEGSTEAGLRAVRAFWDSKAVEMEGFHMVDGSGLSRKNLITPKQLVQVLLAIKNFDVFPSFFSSLPEKQEGVFAKTGGMSLHRGYVGYVGDVAFAILINNCTSTKAMQEKINSIVKKLKDYCLSSQ